MEPLPEALKKEDGVSLHGGMDKTSLMLYLRSDLVVADYPKPPARTGATLDQSMAVAQEANWPEYVGSPRLATRALGEQIWKALSAAASTYASRVLDGEDTRSVKRYGDLLGGVPAYIKVDEGARASEDTIAQKQAEWLKSKGFE